MNCCQFLLFVLFTINSICIFIQPVITVDTGLTVTHPATVQHSVDMSLVCVWTPVTLDG